MKNEDVYEFSTIPIWEYYVPTSIYYFLQAIEPPKVPIWEPCLPETLKLMGFSNKLVNLPSHTHQAIPFKCTIFPFLDYSYIFYHEESLNLYPIWILVWFIWNTLYLVLM